MKSINFLLSNMKMQAVGAICTSRFSVKLFNQYGATHPIAIGFIEVIIFSLMILAVDSTQQFIFAMIILFIRGIFNGLCDVPIQASSVIESRLNLFLSRHTEWMNNIT